MFRFVLLISLLGAASLVGAEPVTFESALELARRSSPDIAVEEARVGASQAAATAAGRLPDPRLAVGIQNLPITGQEQFSLTRDFMTMRQIGFMQEVPNSGVRHARAAAAEASVDRTRAQQRVRVLTVRRDTAVAWLNRYYLERRGGLLDDLDRENRLFAQSVQAQVTNGQGTVADAIAPQQEAAELADRRDELAGEITASRAALRRWIGSAADEPLAGDPPTLLIDPDHLHSHVHEHPDLAVFVPMVQMAQAEVHEAEAMKRPDWGVELSYGRRGSQFSDMMSLQFTFGLPLFPRTRQDPQIAAKRQELHGVESERESMLREHTAELDGELAQYNTITRQLTRLRDLHMPLARQKVSYQFATYKAQKADLTTVLAARRELIDQQIKELDLQKRQAAAAAKLYYFYGEGASQ